MRAPILLPAFTVPQANLCRFLKCDLIFGRNKEGWVCIVALRSQDRICLAYAVRALFLFLAAGAGSAVVYSAMGLPSLLKNTAAMPLESVILMMLLIGWAVKNGRSEGLSPVPLGAMQHDGG